MPSALDVVIYDDAVARPPTDLQHQSVLPDALQWGADATTLYSVDTESTAYSLDVYRVSSSGATLTGAVTAAFPGGGRIIYTQGILYDDNGTSFDPATDNVLGTLAASGVACPDLANKRIFVIASQPGTQAGTQQSTLVMFDAVQYTPLGALPLPALTAFPRHLVRWGSAGLALTASDGSLTIINNIFNLPSLNLGGSGTVLASVNGATAYTVYDVPANDLLWSSQQNALYVSLSSTVARRGNTVTAFDPATGTFGASVFAGSEPVGIAASADGSFLYVGDAGATAVVRAALPALALDESIALGSAANFGPLYPQDLQVAPGSDSTLAVLQTFNGAITPSLAVFDGTTARPQTAVSAIQGIQWGGDAQTLYGYGTGADVLQISTYAVSAAGVTEQPGQLTALTGSVARAAHFNAGLLYGDDGSVFDPASNSILQTFAGVPNSAMTFDTTLGLAYFVSASPPAAGVAISALDLVHGNLVTTLQASQVQGLPLRVVRWGADGLAFNTTAGELVVVRGALVTTPPPSNPCGAALGTSVTTSGPGGTTFSSSLIAAGAGDLAYEPHSGLIYLAVSAPGVANTNCVAALDPQAGSLAMGVFAGSKPSTLAVSDDGSLLYVGLSGAETVERFQLPPLTHDLTIPLVFGPLYNSQPVAGDVQAAPGVPGTIAVVARSTQIDPSSLGVAIFDNSTPRSTVFGTNQAADANTLAWGASASGLYGLNVENGNADFYTLAVGAAGATLVSDVKALLTQTGGRIHFTGGLIYADNGQVLNPTTNTLAGTFNLATVGPPPASVVAVDTTLNLAFFATSDRTSGILNLLAFDATHFTPQRQISIPSLAALPTRIVRWGADGLAVVLNNGTVLLVKGTFVTG